MSATPTQPSNPARHHATIAFAWAVFVVYGSLVPLEYRPRPDAWQSFLNIRWLQLGVGSRADWVANILLYVVLSYFAVGALWTSRFRAASKALLLPVVLGGCIAIALVVEYLQLFFPPRTVSLNDLLAETLGTGIGTFIWFLSGRRIASMWQRFMAGGRQSIGALLALYALAYFGMSFFPYDFLVDAQELAAKLAKPDSLTLGPGPSCGRSFTCGVKLLTEAVLMVPFGVLLVWMRSRNQSRAKKGRPIAGFLLGVLIGILVEGVQIILASGSTQAISILTRGMGAAWGVMLANSSPRRWLQYSPSSVRRAALLALPFYLALVLALNDMFPPQLQPFWAALEKLDGLRFMPFYYHYYTTETAAVRSLLFIAGSYAPIGLVVALSLPRSASRSARISVLLAAALSGAMEILKLFAVGKHPDPTNLLIAGTSAWVVQWIVQRLLSHMSDPAVAVTSPSVHHPHRSLFSRHRLAFGVVLPIVCLSLIVAFSAPALIQSPASAAEPTTTFPPPDALPHVNLPGFKDAHPRLPHPSERDLATLRAQNRAYLETQYRDAKNGSGGLDATIFSAYAEPGSQDLAQLHRRLMELRFTERGNAQVKPLAQAYDWLYPQWTPRERAALQEKLTQGCGYVMHYIRKEALSPYNVFLYNSPLQALMACSVALYRDDPQGEAFMAFTYELWKNRVLPVWRQVMGHNGGWHEGGEYVAIGIGQAIYTLPAIWRAATGEDLFKSEPGIRGFLDFLVYRNRPDGTQFRWGDGSNFLRPSPDAIPLAIEYRNAAAYSLNAPKRAAPVPTAWPWGPLSDDSLINDDAVKQLPPSRFFDGLGMLVSRSSWAPDATYVTFKAGDNFWSHTHLDQGAFTLYKGGELALDSGWYGPAYGSDHHMNYTYQSIAHNLVTVTDPADTQPGPGLDADPRVYANDGGQRRIGSGWGLQPAPIDRAEWEKQRETYHTARTTRHLEDDGLAIAVADLTPAYSNSESGHGTFSGRTRRVERMWRVFGYDSINDAIIVFDDVVATDPGFRKRWLLHTQYQPVLGNAGFEVTMPAFSDPGQGGGKLQGHILAPAQPAVNAIGGPGFEFFVDGKNYDEKGKARVALERHQRGQNELGAWRIEVTPSQENAADQFLVALLPTSAGAMPKATVKRIGDAKRIGAEVQGPHRTTRWWFEPGKQGVQVEVLENGGNHTHSLFSQQP